MVNAIVNKLTEIFAPLMKKKFKKKILDHLKATRNTAEKYQIEKQAYVLDEFDGIYSDYVTLFEQYGYITLFSAVFPWVALAAWANNIMEQRSDTFKYCHLSRRAFPRHSIGIGSWTMAFEVLGYVSVVTNMALIALHPDVREYFGHYSDAQYLFMFVVIEVCLILRVQRKIISSFVFKYPCFFKHILVGLKVVIAYVIPDETTQVTLANRKYKYDSIQALKREVNYFNHNNNNTQSISL